MSNEISKKVLIIGGVAGGASAAARARRLDESSSITLLQSGPDVSYASCGMPYFIGGEIVDRSVMAVQTPQSLRQRFNIDVRVNCRALHIDKAKKLVQARDEVTGEESDFSYDELILALGAEPLKPPIPGIDRPGLFKLRTLQDMDEISNWIKNKDVKHCVVAGAGFVGLEMVEQLVRRNIKVTLVEMASQVLGPLDPEMAAILHKECEKNGVEVIVGDGIAKFSPAEGEDRTSSVLELQSGRKVPKAEMTILGLGVKPDTLIAKEAGLEMAPRGHIVVDNQFKTSVPHIWAVGDSVLVRNPILSRNGKEVTWAVPLAGPANRQGRMVADIIYGRQRKYKGTYGASVVRVFGYVAACVGINEKLLIAKGLPYSVVHVHPGSHAGYFPGAKSINLKLLFDPNDGHVYGASAVGEDGVEKRIDIISTAIQGNMSVYDLADLELCYAPPVGSAKDPVNIAGMAAQNVVDGLVKQIDWKELKELQVHPDTDVVVIDVRNPGEVKNGILVPNAINIPLNDLRMRMHEIPRDKQVILSCQSGQRAYYAYRILAENGYNNIRNLSGAYKTYSAVK